MILVLQQKQIKRKADGLGAILEGTDLTDSGLLMHFKGSLHLGAFQL